MEKPYKRYLIEMNDIFTSLTLMQDRNLPFVLSANVLATSEEDAVSRVRAATYDVVCGGSEASTPASTAGTVWIYLKSHDPHIEYLAICVDMAKLIPHYVKQIAVGQMSNKKHIMANLRNYECQEVMDALAGNSK